MISGGTTWSSSAPERTAPVADIASSAPAVHTPSVRWSQAPFSFALGSSDPETLERARVVFRPWMNAPVAAPHRRFTVERTLAGAWLVHDSLNSGPIERPTAEAAVRTVEFRAVSGLVESAEATTLHAALVARGARGIAILGSTNTGKSTLGAALWQRGFSLLGDDVTVVDPTSARAWPAPRRVGLRFASRALLGDAMWRRIHRSPGCDVTDEGCLFHPDEVDAGPRPSSVRLAALVFLGRRDAAPEPARARPLAAAQALLAVLPYTNVIRRADAGTVIRHYQPLMTRVPAYDLGRGAIGAMAAAVEALLTGPAG